MVQFSMSMSMGSMSMGSMGPAGVPSSPVGFVQPDSLSNEAAAYEGSLHPLPAELTFQGLITDKRRLKHVKFATQCWDGPHLAQAVLGEFSQFDWLDGKYGIDPGDWRDIDVEQEIKELVNLGTMARAQYRDEILAQAEDASSFWANLLMMYPASFPASCTLMEIGKAVGMMVAMYFKRIYQRPRPSQVYPPLMPLLLNPPHASYPNAHALQSNLMSQLLAQEGVRPDMKGPLSALALRVGQNREIAGVHYPSDRKASERMFPGIMLIFNELRDQQSAYREIVDQATKEWERVKEEATPATLYQRPGNARPA
jgi:hypothetical protein